MSLKTCLLSWVCLLWPLNAGWSGELFMGLTGDHTFVVWASPANLTQRGGSLLTLEENERFDAIVFGELSERKWMAGSEFYRRSQRDQSAVPVEEADPQTALQLASVYRGKNVSLYRNGTLLTSYLIERPETFGPESLVLMGLRHRRAQDLACFAGWIDDARIYNVALDAAQLRELKPNRVSQPPPIAWWHFEDGEPVDLMGAFPPAKLVGQARIESGKLKLDGHLSYLITPPEADEVLPKTADPAVAEDFLLNYHLMHPGEESMPGDPNAAFCLEGVYHLHYILRHPWDGRQSFSFVHVTSHDLLHWTWQKTQLQPSFTGHGMFSGTGFITRDGRPAIIYHGEGSGKNQIVIAQDHRLSAWEKPYPVVVRKTDGSEAPIHHWDPDCFRIGDTYYAISGGENPPLFKSQDLKNWTLVGDFLAHQPADVTIGEDISCPNFFRLGERWMLLCISHSLGCRYYLGDWDEQREQFVPRHHGRLNWRREDQPIYGLFTRTDFFAPESVLTTDGRRVMWAWLTTIGPGNRYLQATIQSLPRELTLAADGSLRIAPLRELETLRLDPVVIKDLQLSHPLHSHGGPIPPASAPLLHHLADLPGESVEIRMTVSREQALRKLFGVVLFSDHRGGGLPILFRPESGALRVGTAEAPFSVADLNPDEKLELRIFVDKYLVEVFVNDRQALVAAYPAYRGRLALHAFTVGATTTIERLELAKLKPTNEGLLQARQNRIWQPQTRRTP